MPIIRIIARDKSLHKTLRTLLSDLTIERQAKADLLVAELCGEADCPGVAAIRKLREAHKELSVIAVSGGNSATVTQQAVRLRVDDFFTLPEQSNAFKVSVAALIAGTETPAKSFSEQNGLLGNSPKMVTLRKYGSRVALTDSSVLIVGETGTGKELVAELIHKIGARREKPFVAVNAAAVPDSLFESELFGYEKGAFTGAYTKSQGKLRQAHGGTIFFDEIGDISPSAQAKLLRAIESKEVYPLGACRGTPVDVRLIAATNRDMDALVSSHDFRQDLFYRLDVVRIEMPTLRSNREDIPQLLEHFVKTFNQRFNREVHGFQSDAAELLNAYDWPGNIRQLRNLVEACFVNSTSSRIQISDFPPHFRIELENKVDPQSRKGLIRALQASNWNISRAAWQLHCSRMTLYRKMARYQISRREPGVAFEKSRKVAR